MIEKPWFPTINLERCDGCKGTYKCVGFCPYKVFVIKEGKPFVADPLNCIGGCSSCASLCSNGAIIFPTNQNQNRFAKKDSSMRRILCLNCGRTFLANRETQYCFDCEAEKEKP
jgi:NAD-dependent dihydropyrimidine dehydrogenase PreA subunit